MESKESRPTLFKTLRNFTQKCYKGVCGVLHKIVSFYGEHDHEIDTWYMVIMTGLSVANVMLNPLTAIVFAPLLCLILFRYRQKYLRRRENA